MHMRTKGNCLGCEPDYLLIAADGGASLNRSHRHLVPGWNLPNGDTNNRNIILGVEENEPRIISKHD